MSHHTTPHHTGRKLVGAVLIFIGSGFTLTYLSPSAGAVACSAPMEQVVGYSTSAVSPQPFPVEGASAVMTDRGGYVLCTGSPAGNYSFASVSVTSSDGHYQGISGFIYYNGISPNCVHVFSQQVDSNGYEPMFLQPGCVDPGTQDHLWVQYYQGYTRDNLNSTVMEQRFFNVGSSAYVSFGSDVGYPLSTIPGYSAKPEEWNGLQTQNYYTDAYVSVDNTSSTVNVGPYQTSGSNFSKGRVSAAHVISWETGR